MKRGVAPMLFVGGGASVMLLLAMASTKAEAHVEAPRPSPRPSPGPRPAPESSSRPPASSPARLPPAAPLPGHPKTGSPYGWRTDPISGKRTFHRGLDIPVPTGTPVYAPFDGEVARVDRDGVGKGAFNGNAVLIRIDGYLWCFLHLSSVAVRSGEAVRRGQLLGKSGSTGRSTGPHLHIQVYDPSGQLVDPMTAYPAGTFTRRER